MTPLPPRSGLVWLWILRFPLLGAGLLLALPAFAQGEGWGMAVAGAFQLRPEEGLVLGALGVSLVWSLGASAELLLLAAPERFGLRALGPGAWRRWRRLRILLQAGLLLPLLMRAQQQAPGRPTLLLGSLVGGAAGMAALIWLLGRLGSSRTPRPAAGAAGGTSASEGAGGSADDTGTRSRPHWSFLGPGYQPRHGHVVATAMLALGTAAYLGVGWAFRPGLAPLGCRGGAMQLCFPSLGYLLLIGIALAWLLPGLSFLLDRWRLPVLPLLALAWLLPLLLFDPGHGFRLLDRPPEQAPPPTAPEALAAWLRPGPCRPTAVGSGAAGAAAGEAPPLVLVAAAGGGIKAALWTATVLGGLEERLGARFTGALQAVSAVSGGSLGTVAYLQGLQRRDRPRTAAELAAIRDRLAEGSLRPAFWSLAYADAWRGPAAALAWLGRQAGKSGWDLGLQLPDRALALERSWAAALRAPEGGGEQGVLGWAPAVATGCRALPLINAMAVESGAPVVIGPLRLQADPAGDGAPTPLELPDQIDLGEDAAAMAAETTGSAGERGQGIADQALAPGRTAEPFQALADFGAAYPRHDLAWLTAARLSASFPWITPAARAMDAAGPVDGDPRLGAFHSDGGYFDNYGIVTLVEYLRAILPAYRQAGGRRVLLISIYSRDCPGPGCEGKARTSSIAAEDDPRRLPGLRGLSAGPLLALLSARGATQKVRNLQTLDLLVQRWAGQVDIQRLEFVLEEPLPLSWQLSPAERARLEAAWEREAEAGAAAVAGVLGGP